MRTPSLLLASALLATLAAPTLARAQQGEPASIERARAHMERGQALYLQARFEEAATEFQAAYEAQPFSAFLFNAGVALERAGQPGQAAGLFEQYLARDPQAGDAAAVRERIRLLREAAQTPEVPPLAPSTPPDSPPGTEPTPEPPTPEPPTPAPPEALPEEFKSLLSVRTNPEGAQIIVRRGDEVVARAPGPFAQTLDHGHYSVTIEHPDYQTVSQDVSIEPGRVYVIIVEMSQGQFLGYLRVTSNVIGAQVFVDDREQGPRGQTPFEAPIPVGAHHVWVARPGYQVGEAQAEVGVGDDVPVRVELERLAHGRLRVTGNIDGARVFVDGQLLGTVPFEGDVPAGSRRVHVEVDGMKPWERSVTIERGRLTPVRVRLRPAVDRTAGWVTTVVAALFIGGGVAAGVIGDDLLTELRAQASAGTLTTDDPRIDHGMFLWIGADAGFGLALIMGVLSLYYFLYDDLPPSTGSVLDVREFALAPFLDPVHGSAGLGLAGSF